MRAAIDATVYEVFARISPGDPLCHIGNVNAPADELARVYALKLYDEEEWSEVWIVPRRAIMAVHPTHAPAREAT